MAPNNSSSAANGQPSWEQIVAPCGKHQEPLSKRERERPATPDSGLGTYKAAIPPLITLFVGVFCGQVVFRGIPQDERVKDWFLMNEGYMVFIISVIYIFSSMVWGPRFMQNRKPWQLKEVMMAYNAFQVVFSAYMFIETGIVGWFWDYSFRCQPCDFSRTEKALRMARIAHFFFVSKLIDFADTALFILRGKMNQVSNLHVIHHSCMFYCMWVGVHYMPGGHMTFMGYLNTFVHTVMYSYYFLSGLGPWIRPYLWWKKYLTRMQLAQFIVIFFHTAQLLVFPCPGVPTGLIFWTILYAVIFFTLFVNFYIQAYRARKDKPALNGTASKSNGHAVSNGNGVSSQHQKTL